MIMLPSGRKIGEGEPPFVIAEIGSNWGSLQDCMSSISQAKLCGADAVKFQLFDSKALYGREIYEGRLGHETEWKPIPLKGTLPIDWLPKLAEKAKACGIEFMCSAFSPELIDAVDPHVNLHKVASSEMCHVRMLERLRAIGKPVILSTGAQHMEDIARAIDVLAGRNTQTPVAVPAPIILMYCVAAYPANEVRLENINELRNRFHSLVGFSSHSLDYGVVPRQALEQGASVIEVHFQAVDGIYPDTGHSLRGFSFRRMVDILHQKQIPNLGPTPEEKPMILRHKRRLIATRDIQVGEKLIEGENFGIYRSLRDDTHAFSPFLVDQVQGKTALKPISAGSGIGPGDI
jgi:sialic acid synthase SpsE